MPDEGGVGALEEQEQGITFLSQRQVRHPTHPLPVETPHRPHGPRICTDLRTSWLSLAPLGALRFQIHECSSCFYAASGKLSVNDAGGRIAVEGM